ncbi:uncharacterized protein RBU33_016582 [Hipposideros larvatus]
MLKNDVHVRLHLHQRKTTLENRFKGDEAGVLEEPGTKIKVPEDLVSGENPLPCSQMAIFSLCPPMLESGLHLSDLGRETCAVTTPAEPSQEIEDLVLCLLSNPCHQH